MKIFARKNKNIIIALSILIVLIIINICYFFLQYSEVYNEFKDKVSSYSFWRFVTSYGIADYIVVSMIILIGIGCVQTFHKELNSGLFKDIILRKKYNIYIFQQIFSIYKKALFFGPIINIIVFMIGLIFFQNKLNTEYMSAHISNFFYNGLNHPLLYMFLAIICSYLGILFMCNIVLIFTRVIKKFYLSIIASFMCINFICLCMEIFGRYYLYDYFKIEFFNWFSPYRLFNPSSRDYMSQNILFGLILFLISFIVVAFMYFGKKNKEKLVIGNV